jgi:lysozyme
MKTSATGVALIKQFEGLELVPYKDVAGHWTVGYGHKIEAGESFPKLSEADAEALLRIDLVRFEAGVLDITKGIKLSQNQFDALVAFAYNVGLDALRKSTLIRLLQDRDPAGAAAQFGRWIHAGGVAYEGLRRRRAAERRLFETA